MTTFADFIIKITGILVIIALAINLSIPIQLTIVIFIIWFVSYFTGITIRYVILDLYPLYTILAFGNAIWYVQKYPETVQNIFNFFLIQA